MRRTSLYLLVFFIFIVLFLGTTLGVYFTMRAERKTLTELAVEGKIDLAKSISGVMGSGLWQWRRALITGMDEVLVSETLNFEDVVFFRVVESDGRIYQSTIREDFGKSIEDPVINTRETVIRDEIFQGDSIKVVIYPGSEYRTYWVGFTLAGIEKQIRAAAIRNIITGLGLSGLIALILFLIMTRIVGPIKKLTLVSREIAKGNFEVKSDIKSKTEIGELAVAFNEMIRDLKESHTALEESKTVLEIKIAARTKELRELTEKQEEIIKERTKEIQEKMAELERFNKLAVGRELKMVELKEEIEKLKKELEKSTPST